MTDESSAGKAVRKAPVRKTPRKNRQTADSIARDAEAMRLRSEGWTLTAISEHLGFGGHGNVVRAIERWTTRTVAEPAEAVRNYLLARLDAATNVAMVALRADVPVLHHGEPVHVTDPRTGQTVWLRDMRTNLAAADRVASLVERMAKLQGLEAPDRMEINVTSEADQAVADLLREVQAHNQLLTEKLRERTGDA